MSGMIPLMAESPSSPTMWPTMAESVMDKSAPTVSSRAEAVHMELNFRWPNSRFFISHCLLYGLMLLEMVSLLILEVHSPSQLYLRETYGNLELLVTPHVLNFLLHYFLHSVFSHFSPERSGLTSSETQYSISPKLLRKSRSYSL